MPTLTEHLQAAMRYFALRRFEEAKAHYQAVLQIDPTFTTALHGVSACLFQQEKWDDSIAVAEQILKIDADDADAQGHISRCWMRKGDVPRAEAEAAKEKSIRWKLQLREQKAQGGSGGSHGTPPST